MIVDPAVARRKFDKEVRLARSQPYWQQQGVWMLRAEFPIVFVIFATPKMMPWCPGVIAGLHIDFSDYDIRPPSVRFVDPFTEAALTFTEMKWHFPRTVNAVRDRTSGQITAAEQLAYVQSFDNIKPFLCLPGVREYHECSAHSGDSWFMHRSPREGLLVHLLTILQRYGPGSIQGITFNLTPTPVANFRE